MIHSPINVDEYNSIRNDGFSVIKYSAEWCGPCKLIHPHFEKLSKKYKNINFVNADIEILEGHEDCKDIKTIPHFKIFLTGKLKYVRHGTDIKRVEEKINQYLEQKLIDV